MQKLIVYTLALFCLAGCRHISSQRKISLNTDLQAKGDWAAFSWQEDKYRVYLMERQREEGMMVSVMHVSEEKDWEQWLRQGAPGAEEHLIYIIDRNGNLQKIYDRLLGSYRMHSYQLPLDIFRARHGKLIISNYALAKGEGIKSSYFVPENFTPNEIQNTPWFGIYGKKVALNSDTTKAKTGLQITLIPAYSLMDKAGLKPGDTLIKIGPWDYDHELITDYNKLNKTLIKERNAGDQISLEYIHVNDEKEEELKKVTITVPQFPIPLKGLSETLRNRILMMTGTHPARDLLNNLAGQKGINAELSALYKNLAKRQEKSDPFRLWHVTSGHLKPWALTDSAEKLSNLKKKNHKAQLETTANILNLNLKETGEPEFGSTLKEHVDFMEAILESAARANKQAFAELSDDERHTLLTGAQTLVDGFIAKRMMMVDELDRQKKNLQFLNTAAKVDMQQLLQQAAIMHKIINPDFLETLKKTLAKEETHKGIIFEKETKWGKIIISGMADDRHYEDAAILIDLGGNDFYANNTGSSLPKSIPSALIIDFDGDDTYLNSKNFRQGCGLLGTGILLDIKGKDTYTAAQLAQGSALLGFGFLYDYQGADIYRGRHCVQGVGQFGAGILEDAEGPNRFHANLASQGVGLAAGVGILFSSGDDKDSYYCSGEQPSNYGDKGSFEGWGQGVGIGHRPYASGGIGMLVDNGGDDEFEAGTFSQGGGYYYGMGILRNRGNGNDIYNATRYGTGFSAHQSFGIFIEEGGNDRYTNSFSVGQGMAWDQSVTFFIEKSGNDYYKGSWGHGSAAMNGIAVFIDESGEDTYLRSAPGSTHGNTYHNGISIGLFIDLGAEKNLLNQNPFNETLVTADEHGFFLQTEQLDKLPEMKEEEEAKADLKD